MVGRGLQGRLRAEAALSSLRGGILAPTNLLTLTYRVCHLTPLQNRVANAQSRRGAKKRNTVQPSRPEIDLNRGMLFHSFHRSPGPAARERGTGAGVPLYACLPLNEQPRCHTVPFLMPNRTGLKS
jgi:hypothetical protein